MFIFSSEDVIIDVFGRWKCVCWEKVFDIQKGIFSGHIGMDVLWLLFMQFIWKNIFEQSSKFATKVILNVDFKWYKCYFESVNSVFKSIMWSLFLPLNISTPKELQKLNMLSKFEQILSGTCRKFKDRNHAMLKKLLDGESWW